MCFSANASFGIGIVLSAVGVASIKKVKQSNRYPFASIPLIFAVQQVSEGFLWLSLTNPRFAFLQQASTYTFLFFAQILWPIWVPFSIILMSKKAERKMIEKILVIVGGLVSIYLAFCLVTFDVNAEIIGSHIVYKQDYPSGISRYSGALYIIATILPPYFSSFSRMWILGFAILISYLITNLFYADFLVSVWCFFAAVISIIVLALMNHMIASSKNSI